jgi:hypothetical protein
MKSRHKENLRTFAKSTMRAKRSKTITEDLCRYVESVIDVFAQNHAVSVLEDPRRPRP